MSNVSEKYEAQNIQQEISERDEFTPERYDQFARYLPKDAKDILDVGCNTGRGGERLKQNLDSINLYGLDCVKERLDALPNAYAKGIYGLSTEIPTEDKTFDAIVAGEFLEHLYPGDVDRTLCEFQRVLKIGGRLLLTTPNPKYLRNKLTRSTVYGVSHLTQHYPDVLSLRFRMHGFSGIKILGSGKMSRYLGVHFPIRSVYGSYLIFGDKI